MNKANKILANRSSLRSKLLEVQETIPFQSVDWKREWNCPFFGRDWSLVSLLERTRDQEGVVQRLCHRAETESLDRDLNMQEELSEDDEAVVMIVLDETGEEDGEQEDGTDQEGSRTKKRRIHYKYAPLSFCVTRWYSAWTVMCRFYGLWDAIMALPEFCGSDPNVKTADVSDLVAAVEGLEKNDLFNVISFLKPLVEGIDYCQKDGTYHLDVGEMLQSVFSFYEEHSGDERGRE